MTKHRGNQRGRGRNERGAILLQVAIGSVVLMAFSMYVVDYGLMWVGRRQAQNAADGAALAGAIAMAFDKDDRSPGGAAKTAAYKVSQSHLVIDQVPNVNDPTNGTLTKDILFYTDDATKFPPECADNSCIRVDVYRNQQRGNALPTPFGDIVGVSNQGVRATATARALPGNATQCLRPWAVADKWLEGPTLDSDGDGFTWRQSNKYTTADGDSYVAPTANSPGTGFSNKDANGDPVDWGYQFTLKLFNPSNGNNNSTFVMSSGWAMALDLPNNDTPTYQKNISGCTSAIVGIAPPGSTCPAEDLEAGCVGVLTGGRSGQDRQGMRDLMAEDSSATWDRTMDNGRGGVNSTQQLSKRIVPVAVFDTGLYMASGYNGSNGIVRVTNILGFFIEGFCDDNSFYHESYLTCSGSGQSTDIVGRMVSYPAININGAGNIGNAAFGQVIRLIR